MVLSLNKYASNCVERVLQHADEEIMSILTTNVFKQGNLERMMADDYAKCALDYFAPCRFRQTVLCSLSVGTVRNIVKTGCVRAWRAGGRSYDFFLPLAFCSRTVAVTRCRR